MTTKQINAIFTLTIYHFCDCCYEGKKAQQLLEKAHLGPWNVQDKEERNKQYAEWAIDRYKEIIKDHVAQNWGDEWRWTHDYWGAEGLFRNPGWNAPQDGGYYVGDSSFQIMWFDSMEALEAYTKTSLEEAQQLR